MVIFTKISISVLAAIAAILFAVTISREEPRESTGAMNDSPNTVMPADESSTALAAINSDEAPKAATAQLAIRTDAEWKDTLTSTQYSVLREGGTEYPYTSDLLHETRAGTYVTADCGEPVFRSEKKFDSGTGWPSFYEPIAGSVVIKEDTSLGVTREEVETPICHSHLGHLFHDAPQTPTGDRYCINGVALRFIPD